MRIYKLDVSDEPRYVPVFDDDLSRALMLLPDDERLPFLNRERPLRAELVPPCKKCLKTDLEECDLYEYGGNLLFSERSAESLQAAAGFTESLVPVRVEDHRILYLFAPRLRADVLEAASRFKVSCTIDGVSVPMFLIEAAFKPDVSVVVDIFSVAVPTTSVLPLRETLVTEAFVDDWRRAGLRGADFVEVGSLPEAAETSWAMADVP